MIIDISVSLMAPISYPDELKGCRITIGNTLSSDDFPCGSDRNFSILILSLKY
jgi:hypothetical protein